MMAIVLSVAALGLTGCEPASADTAADPATPPAGEPVALDELPLDRGYYVRTDESCAGASAAGVQLLRSAGLQWVTSHCLFDRIEQLGPATYRVTQFCGDQRETHATTALYEITDRHSFSFTDDNGWEHAARLCPQRELPEPWRSEDISDLID
jgi:hypothetical protein